MLEEVNNEPYTDYTLRCCLNCKHYYWRSSFGYECWRPIRPRPRQAGGIQVCACFVLNENREAEKNLRHIEMVELGERKKKDGGEK